MAAAATTTCSSCRRTRPALPAPAAALVVALLAAVLGASAGAGQQLDVGYYSKTCPAAEDIVRNETAAAVRESPDLAAALLRLHYHDCFVQVPAYSFLFLCASSLILHYCYIHNNIPSSN